MQLSLVLKAYSPSYFPSTFSITQHTPHDPYPPLCMLLRLQRLTDILDFAVREWFQHFPLWKHTLSLGDKKIWCEDVHSLQKLGKCVLVDLLLLYKEKENS